jgi:hypothetical protein
MLDNYVRELGAAYVERRPFRSSRIHGVPGRSEVGKLQSWLKQHGLTFLGVRRAGPAFLVRYSL